MRQFRVILGFLLLASCGGCSLFATAARNICFEHSLYRDEARLRKRTRNLAEEAWDRCASKYGPTAQGAFEDGYIDGYADYLFAGQTTDPWPTPPNGHWFRSYTTPERLRCIEEYQAGFHQGASDAQASGLRSQFVVPTILPIDAPIDDMPAIEVPSESPPMKPPERKPASPGASQPGTNK